MAPCLKLERCLNSVCNNSDDLRESFGSVKKHFAAGYAGLSYGPCSGVCCEAMDDSLALDLRLGQLEERQVRRRRFGHLPALRTVARELKDRLAFGLELEAAANASCQKRCSHEVKCPCEA